MIHIHLFVEGKPRQYVRDVIDGVVTWCHEPAEAKRYGTEKRPPEWCEEIGKLAGAKLTWHAAEPEKLSVTGRVE